MNLNKIKCPTPPMGWNSYCSVNCDPKEELLIEAADKIVELGLKDAGYVYVNLDDGWLRPERDENGRLQIKEELFPHGMKYLTDYIHTKGLKAGTYLGCGLTTWNGGAGSLGHEYEDARQIAEWGFDYLKYDFHPTAQDPERDIICEYIKMGMAVESSGREIIYNMCEHGRAKPYLWGQSCADLWRIGSDVRDLYAGLHEPDNERGTLRIIEDFGMTALPYGSKGCFNDPDMVTYGSRAQNDWMGPGCTDAEYRSGFALWCMMPAPLLLGAKLDRLTAKDVKTLTNPRLLAIDQDILCIPAERVRTQEFGPELWVRKLSDFRWAVALMNRGDEDGKFTFTWEEMNLSPNLPMEVQDAWSGDIIGTGVKKELVVEVASHDTAVLILRPAF